MKASALTLLLAAGLAACRNAEPRQQRQGGDAQLVSLVVRSEPSGARVQVNRIQKTWTTPCDIADFSVAKGPVEVELSLPGYQTVRARATYNGYEPVILQMTLQKIPEAPAPGEAPRVSAAPVPPPSALPAARPAPEAPAPAPLRAEAAAGGTRLRVSSANAKIRIQAKVVIADPEKPGEYLLPNVPPDRAVVDFMDPATGAVLQSVEFAPALPPPGAVKEAPAPAAAPDRVGEVKVVSKTFGVFIKLDPGLALQPGEEILIFREGREVARSRILMVTGPDPTYPDGAAQVQKDGSIQKGDEVRRQKP